MPEILKTNGENDYAKLFMGMAAALLFLLQGINTIRHENLSNKVVPRHELTETLTLTNEQVENFGRRLDVLESLILQQEAK